MRPAVYGNWFVVTNNFLRFSAHKPWDLKQRRKHNTASRADWLGGVRGRLVSVYVNFEVDTNAPWQNIMDNEALLQANKNLNKKIDKLEKELEETRMYRDMYGQCEMSRKELFRQLAMKRGTIRIVENVGEVMYTKQIVNQVDSQEGLFIEIK